MEESGSSTFVFGFHVIVGLLRWWPASFSLSQRRCCSNNLFQDGFWLDVSLPESGTACGAYGLLAFLDSKLKAVLIAKSGSSIVIIFTTLTFPWCRRCILALRCLSFLFALGCGSGIAHCTLLIRGCFRSQVLASHCIYIRRLCCLGSTGAFTKMRWVLCCSRLCWVQCLRT